MINAAGIALLKEFERGRDVKTGKLLPVGVPATEAYNDRPDGTGRWTISWGLTGPDIKKGTVWSPKKCVAEFNKRVEDFEEKVRAECTREPTDNQLAAMVCLAFNIGMGWKARKGPDDRDGFRQSTVLRMHNAGKWAEAANAFSMWKKDNGIVLAGLVQRRAAETALYISPEDDMELSVRVVPQADDPAARSMSLTNVATGASVAFGAAQQAVANVSSIWDTIHDWGVDPRVVMLALGAAGVVALGYFVYDAYQRRKAGDR